MAIDQSISVRPQRPHRYVSRALITGKNARTIDLKEEGGWVKKSFQVAFC